MNCGIVHLQGTFSIVKCDMIKGMSRMSRILIFSYRLKEVINPYVLHCFEAKELFVSLEPDV